MPSWQMEILLTLLEFPHKGSLSDVAINVDIAHYVKLLYNSCIETQTVKAAIKSIKQQMLDFTFDDLVLIIYGK